jgi:hypothetical protein
MSRNKNNLAILPVLIGIAMLAFVCGSAERTESSPPQTPTPLPPSPVLASDQADAVAIPLLTQTPTEAPRVSITFNDDSRSSYELMQRTPPDVKASGKPDLGVWYGEYFTDNKLRRETFFRVLTRPQC